MKKLVLLTVLVVIALTLMGGLALAGGWTTISYTATHDPNDTVVPDGQAIWNPSTASPASPHGLFSSSSNKCRVCHAVHEADSTSWRLLKATSKVTECDVCHGNTGLTLKRPYAPKTYSIRGEHTLTSGAIAIPDSSGSISLANGLGCNNCHSVHGANTLIGYGAADMAGWDPKILRRNPNGDGNILAIGVTGAADSTTVDGDVDAKHSNFCSDCHDDNPNWNVADTTPRANGKSHVQGPAADGELEVNSATQTVAWDNAPTTGCTGCHSAPDTGNAVAGTPGVAAPPSATSAFPHQTIGAKLLADTFTLGAEATAVGDATRIIPDMDQVCGSCHTQGLNIDAPGAAGVGVSF